MTSGFSEDNLAKVMDGIAFDKWPKAKIISHLSAALKAEINFFQGKTEQQKFYYQALITTITNIVLSILKMQLPNDVSNITLYSASETAEQFDERLGWPDNWDIDIKQVNGAHSFMLEPEVLETLSMSDDIESIAKQLWTSVLDVRAANAPTYISNLIKHAPNNLRWRFMRGKINAHNGQRDLALFDFKKIFKILEKRSDIESALYQQTLLELAITYQRLADSASTQAKERAKYEKAITYFAKIANPDVTALRECGHCYRGLERYSSAISKFKQAISLCTEDYRNYYYLGKLYLDLGDYVPARDNLKLALDRCESTDFNHADISALLREAENHIEQNPNVNYQRR